MLDETADGRWFVRRAPDAAPEALVERFGTGYRLTAWSLDAGEAESLGVHTAAHLAETAWWRHRDLHGGRTDG